MVESKYVLNGLISGFIMGIYSAAFYLIKRDVIVDVVIKVLKYQLGNSGLPEEAISKIISESIKALNLYVWIAIPAIIFTYAVVGSVFGALHDFIDKKLRKIPLVLTALLSGIIFTSTMGIIPLLLLSLTPSLHEVIFIIIHSIGLITILSPEIVYTISLVILTIFNNPRAKMIEE